MDSLLFLRARSLPEWREASQTTHRRQYQRLLRQADSYATWRPPPKHPRDSITYIGMAAANLALAYRMEGRAQHLATLREWLRVGIGYPHWGLARMPDHDLDAAWLLFGFSLAYNWVGHMLPQPEVEALVQKLHLQASRLYAFALETEGRWWSSAYWQNHNWICYGGLLTAALALHGQFPQATEWFQRAATNFQTLFPLLPPDGSDYEGVVYWRYGLPWLLIAAHLLQEEGGIDLHDSDFLRHTFRFRLYLSGPNLVDTANFGDCHDRRSAHSRALCYRLASLYRDEQAQWLAEHFEETGEWEREGREGLVKPGLLPEAWLDLVWYDPSVPATPPDVLPRTAAFPDMGLVSTRSSWKPNATFLAFKCGRPNGAQGWQMGQALDRVHDWNVIKASHAHPDENSFVLMRGSDYLVVDEGYSQAKRTAHHSTVLVDGQGQYREAGYNAFAQLGPGWGGRLEEWLAGDGFTYLRGEGAGAYAPKLGLERFCRQMMLLDDDLVVICDDLRSGRPRRFQWLLQTDAPAVSQGEDRFVATAGESRMAIHVLAPRPFHRESWTQEVTANPTSAKPDWILRREQHTFVLTPSEATRHTRFLVALGLGDRRELDMEATLLECEGGSACAVPGANGQRILAFAQGNSRLRIAQQWTSDARWIAVTERGVWAGGLTFLWQGERLRFLAARPVNVVLHWDQCQVVAQQATWIQLSVASQPAKVWCNGKLIQADCLPVDDLLRLKAPPGESVIRW